MKRTEILWKVRRLLFDEACGGWQKGFMKQLVSVASFSSCPL